MENCQSETTKQIFKKDEKKNNKELDGETFSKKHKPQTSCTICGTIQLSTSREVIKYDGYSIFKCA